MGFPYKDAPVSGCEVVLVVLLVAAFIGVVGFVFIMALAGGLP